MGLPLVEVRDEPWVDVNPVYPSGVFAGIRKSDTSVFSEEFCNIYPPFGLDFLNGWRFVRVPIEIPSQKGGSFRVLAFLRCVPSFKDFLGEGIGVGVVGSPRDSVNC